MATLPHDLPVDEANLIALWAEAILYGTHCVLFGVCMNFLLQRQVGNRSTRALMGITIALFVLASMHIITSLRGGLEGFIWSNPPATAYFADFAATPYRMKDTLYVLIGYIADGLLLWRLWVVWGHNWKIAFFPAILYLAAFVCGIMNLFHLWTLNASDPLFLIGLGEWVTALWSISLATNISVTALIVARIWHTARHAPRRYYPVMAALIESGAMYSLSIVFLMTLFELKANAGQIAADIATQIAGIAPTLIIVRLSMQMEMRTAVPRSTGSTTAATYPSQVPNSPPSPMKGRGRSDSSAGVVVEMTRQTLSDNGSRINDKYGAEEWV